MLKNKVYLLLFLLVGLSVGAYFLSKTQNKPLRTLPYFEPKNREPKVSDKAHHHIPDFSFTDQYGETVNTQTVKQKVYVCDYFFTTCHSICPIMSTQMERVYKAFTDRPDFLILSHTVDPEADSIPQLLSYAEKHGVHNKQWRFLTGTKKSLYELARKGYLLNAEEGKGDADDFIHTQNFALIDKNRCIRGYYDGTDSSEVSRLIKDIRLLFDAYDWEEKK